MKVLVTGGAGLVGSHTASDWRPSGQRVYISDISRVKKELNWEPKIKPEEGIKN